MSEWQPIETAPKDTRLMVCGWQRPSGRVAGYWWYHEDTTDTDGAPCDRDAQYWAPLVIPAFPAPPVTP